MDLLALYSVMNEGTINVLEQFTRLPMKLNANI